MKKLEEKIQLEIRKAIIFKSSNWNFLYPFVQNNFQPFTRKEIHDLGFIENQNFSYLFDVPQHLVKESDRFVYDYDTLEMIIRQDNIDQLKLLMQHDDFDFEMLIELHDCTGERFVMNVIDACALFNSEKCLSIILKNYKYKTNDEVSEWTSIDYAAYNGNFQILKKFEENGWPITSSTYDAAFFGHENEILKWLFMKQFVPKEQLFMKIYTNNIEGVGIMMKEGVDINACMNKTLITPLMEACQFGYFCIIKMLIQSGANINCISKTISKN